MFIPNSARNKLMAEGLVVGEGGGGGGREDTKGHNFSASQKISPVLQKVVSPLGPTFRNGSN